jgi:rhomboid protease GluP
MALTASPPFHLDGEQALRWGADYGPLTLTTQPWRLLTAMFVHGGLLHIATNMWCLWNLGRMAENIFGRVTFLLAYLFTGVAASLLSVLLHPNQVSVGASGAIFGVAGALITALYLGKLPIPRQHLQMTLNSLVIFAVVNLAIGASVPIIDNAGHIGGLIAGLVVGALLAPSLTRDADSKARNRQLVFSALAVVLGAAIWLVRR